MAVAKLMGVVNVTPDSFSDGGDYFDPDAAIAHGRALAAEGADILDVGGESTRPGADEVGAEEECRRILPVIGTLAGEGGPPVSVDTSKAAVAAAAIDAGATIVNDVTALSDPEMAPLCAERGVELVLMHMQGRPRTMQEHPSYGDVVEDVRAFLAERVELAVAAGVLLEKVWVDPGIGFGKTVEHNIQLVRRLRELLSLGRPLLIGTSRKSFLGKITGAPVGDRLGATIASCVLAAANGADALRVHDVGPVREALAVTAAILDPQRAAEIGDRV
ncbi:MAG: dihydropteroate synthase [Solirubrobacterales bacterium]